ncbi:MAG TPA: RNA polymerase sigma-54 factor [Bacteroidales bacterium]|nr:MAG: RNA polymerase sigma-54 factor [Bacteroidetes bacterium GWE2_42_24]OFY25933.1 MAG: RNA polymerase sigma-54 factor [Bacteroidetes bacterium GWF2_43_11]HBZ66659.1 RNA polymerase sigma-54 factor [Bacteroidales bacterium]
MLSQKLQQKLLQKLSPQQILLMKLLQIPSMALEQRIKQEIEENPALEEAELQFEDEYTQPDSPEEDIQTPIADEDEPSGEDHDDFGDPEPVHDKNEEFDFEDYLEDDDIPLYRLQANNSSPDDDVHETPFVSGASFQEMLQQQLGLRVLTERQIIIGNQIIGNIDDSGYLNRELDAMIDDLAFIYNLEVKRPEIVQVLEIIQQFDPPGIAARSLRECLLLQLRRMPLTSTVEAAIKIIDRNFIEFTKKHFDKIQKRIQLSDDQIKDAVNVILTLNPKPGNSLNENQRTSQYIIPDFFVYNHDGELELVLNSRNMPELKLNRTYTEMLETFVEARGKATSQQKDAAIFVKQKVDSARWFIDAIRQRQQTLSVTMTAIMEYQREFFLSGDEKRIRPMILKDIAERVRLDISTISRVANSKYVQTPYGTYLLKFFFSESLTNDSGEEVSTREIKKILTDCIEGEDKTNPVTDEELMAILKEKGYVIARRTIAKYREHMNIPVARLRREL